MIGKSLNPSPVCFREKYAIEYRPNQNLINLFLYYITEFFPIPHLNSLHSDPKIYSGCLWCGSKHRQGLSTGK